MFYAVVENVAGSLKVWTGEESRRGTAGEHEVLIWQGEAASREDALRLAAQADPRVDIKWMRVRHELDHTREKS